MEKIVSAGNIEAPLYHLIIEKGYSIEVKGEYLIANKDDLEIIGNNAIELAGIILLRENKGMNWKVSDDRIEEYLRFLNNNEK